jgi:toxin ParE1/3/4
MRRYRLSRRADHSLQAIASYIGRQASDLSQGLAFVSRLRAKCEALAMLPGAIGRPREDIGPNVRGFVFGNYSILFRYGDETIDILDVVHVRRDREATRRE